MKAGLAQIDITPPIGTALTGYIARDGGATGVHDPLYAKALVVADGESQAAVVTCDVLGLRLSYVAAVRAAIEAATGIPAAHVLIACSHTHAGPATIFLQGTGDVDEGYLVELASKLVTATQAAQAELQPARFGVGHGDIREGVHNRRTPGDVMDPDLGILRIVDEAGQTFGVLLNYACHPTCVTGENQLLSAEYCGLATNKIQQETGAIALFFTGAIGDVGPVRRGWDVLEAIGNQVADEALRLLDGIETADWNTVSTATLPLDLPLSAPLTETQLDAELVRWNQFGAASDSPLLPPHPKVPPAMIAWAETTLAQVQSYTVPTTVATEIQAVRIGELYLVTAPGELFVELGLAVKAGIGSPHVFLCGFGNDNLGYIPARRAYPHGGYEINDAYRYYGYPAALAPEAGELYVAESVALAQAL